MKAPRVATANIVSWDSGGLSTDIDILSDSLKRAGCNVRYKGRRHRTPRNRLHSLWMTAGVWISKQWSEITNRPQFEVNFFLESVFPEYVPLARVNTLLVNPEWFRDEIYDHLPSLDFLLCKTPDGVETVRELDIEARNIGFSSPDKRLPQARQADESLRCLHLSGQSALKGSEAVVEAWSRHPEWPELTVVRREKRYGGESAPPLQQLSNVTYMTEFVPDEQLQKLQNECEIHVIPSLAEGYGHVIGEAVSCAAVVITTDAPPMNELVDRSRGFLVRVERTERKFRSKLNYVSVNDLERNLNTVFAMSSEERLRIGENAREWFEAQQAGFDLAIRDLVDELLAEDRR